MTLSYHNVPSNGNHSPDFLHCTLVLFLYFLSMELYNMSFFDVLSLWLYIKFMTFSCSHRLSFSLLCSIVRIYLGFHSTACRHLRCFQLWAIINSTAVDMSVCACVLGIYPGEGLQGSKVFSLLEILPHRFSKWFYQPVLLSAVFDG